MTVKQIGIAIVEDSGRYLVGTRSTEQVLAGCAEFPGGKCLPDEAPAACAERECLEETDLHVQAETLLYWCEFSYPHGSVDLHFWLCRRVSEAEEPQHGFRWIDRAALADLPFPEANQHVVRLLIESDCPRPPN